MIEDVRVDAARPIGEALARLDRVPDLRRIDPVPVREPSAHIEYCLSRLAEGTDVTENPVRTVHHLSCTGGTLFAKCIAAMPNVLLLNEVDPLSSLPFRSGKPAFTPNDLVALVRQGDPAVSSDLVIRMFVEELAVLRQEQARIGRAMVLRDHSHSHFLTGNAIPDRPTLRELLSARFPVRSLVTVRDPVDSYLSMMEHGWHRHFDPPNFDEYCRRYLTFLESYTGVEIVRYEDFVAEPKSVMVNICRILGLVYSADFIENFDVFRFSGDSGRSGGAIAERPRRSLSDEFSNEIAKSENYKQLSLALSYNTI